MALQAQESQEAPQSNFIAGTYYQWAWDATTLAAFKKCPRYYQLKHIEGWEKGEGIHLRWGNEFHQVMEDYENAKVKGASHDDAVRYSVRELLARIADWDPDPKTKSEALKTKANLVRSAVWYLDYYEEDAAKTVILSNGRPAVEVSFSFELDYGPKIAEHEWHWQGERRWKCVTCGEEADETIRQPESYGNTCIHLNYLLCGHLDRIVTFANDLYVMDRKTTTTTPGSYYFVKFDMDVQMSLYTLAGQIILGSPIKGVIVDALQVAVNFSRPVRGFTYRTKDQLDEWLEDTKRWLALAEQCASEAFWPMNDTSCDKFGGCEFAEVCARAPGVRKRWLEAGFRRREPWNPLKVR